MKGKSAAVAAALKAIAALTEDERANLFAELVRSPLSRESGYTVVLSGFLAFKNEYRKYVRNRRPDSTRLKRGATVLKYHRQGISWKEIVPIVLRDHPDWFPEYKTDPPRGQDRERLKEKLRRMARDAEAKEPKA